MKFGGGNKCAVCQKTVYPQEEVAFDSKFYHKECFKCSICDKTIDGVSKAGSMDGKVSHRNCFQKQMQTSGGKYGGEKVVAGVKAANVAANQTPAPAAAAAAPVVEKKEKEEPKPVEKKEEPKPAAAKPAAAAAPAGGGSIDRSQTNKIFIEKYDSKTQKEPVIVKVEGEDGAKTGIFIGNCKGPDLCIKIEGKVKNITVSNCHQCGIVFDNCITTVELIGSKRCQVQALEVAGSYVVDKCDRIQMYLADASIADKVVVYSAQSACTNCMYSTPDGEDMEEHAIPDQMISTFKKGEAPVHDVVIPDAE